MREKGWRVARLEDVPRSAEIPVLGSTLTPEEEEQAVRERDPEAAERWRSFAENLRAAERVAHAVRRYFGIASFGINAFEAPAGAPLIVPHDETAYGQEELHVVVRGRARFVCDGEEVELGPGEALYARPEVHREAHALEPTMMLVIGGVPGEPYRPPTWSRDWQPPARG